MVGTSDIDDLYILSYLIKNSEDNEVIGYANLAARVLYLKNEIESDDNMSNIFAERMGDLVERTEENMLMWEELRDCIESARNDRTGSMFLNVRSAEKEPNEWVYRFESSAPESILEDKLEELSERDEALKQKIINAGQVEENDLFEVIYE